MIGRAGGAQIRILAGQARIATTPADAAAAWRSLGELLGLKQPAFAGSPLAARERGAPAAC